jgi:LacI family transcriptional regulator
MKDVAKAVGVHVSTVSRALDAKTSHRIRPEVIEQIRRACIALDYRSGFPGDSLKANRTRTVGLVVPDITDPFFPPLIRGVEEALAHHRYLAVLANTDRDERREAEIVDLMSTRGLDGLILTSVEGQDDLVSRLAGAGLPIVTVNHKTDDPRVSSVVHDAEGGTGQILTHLIALGHRRIATIAGPQTQSTGQERYRAFQRHLRRVGLDEQPGCAAFAETYVEAEGERCADVLMAAGKAFTAIVCASDRLAVGAITALRRRGLDCPKDVSVTGHNDMPIAEQFVPPLTTVRVDLYREGVTAAELLVEMMERAPEPREPKHIVLPVEIVIRASTRAVG